MSNTNSLLETNNLIIKKRSLPSFLAGALLNYDIEDRAGTKLGEAFLSFPGLKFVVNDATGSEVMHIERGRSIDRGRWQLRVSFRDEFTFYDPSGEELGAIQREVKFLGKEFWVEKDGVESMRIYVDFDERNYKMHVRGFQVASAHRDVRMFRRDQLEISITGGVDRRVVIGAVIVIEFLNATTGISSSGE